MLDNFFIKSPAKINLFLKVYNQRQDGFHIIKSGITFLNLFNEIRITANNQNNIEYAGPFKPSLGFYKDDILLKILNELSTKDKFKIIIKKNIPSQAGLGSASTDAASLIRFLLKQNIINNIDDNIIHKIGSDVLPCFYKKNCIVSGVGDIIDTNVKFPKYYFILVKPKINFSTKKMYSKIKNYINFNSKVSLKKSSNEVNYFIREGNDFEKIFANEKNHISNLLAFLSKLDNNIFARLTGSGSCCYAVFDKKIDAKYALDVISKEFGDYWTCIAENNVEFPNDNS